MEPLLAVSYRRQVAFQALYLVLEGIVLTCKIAIFTLKFRHVLPDVQGDLGPIYARISGIKRIC